jgi:dolichol kinase
VDQKQATGGEKLIQCLEREGVDYVFGLSGGAVIPIFDALVGSKIQLVLVRHEQGATHMADGYARSTGKPGVALVTSGPGATNTVTGLLTALMDSAPIVVICGQTNAPMLGKDAFQEADVTGITYPVVKHSYLVKDAETIPRIVREAFHLAQTGRPGPVLIDVPKDVGQGPCAAPFTDELDLPGYSVPTRGDADAIAEAARLLIPRVNDLAKVLVGPFMRPHEEKGLTGAPAFTGGVFLAFLFFEPAIALASLVPLIFGDRAGLLVGKSVGRISFKGKTLEGSLACLAASFLIYISLSGLWPEVFGYGWIVLFAASLIGTLAEALPRPFDDNLTIPIAVGLFLTFVS